MSRFARHDRRRRCHSEGACSRNGALSGQRCFASLNPAKGGRNPPYLASCCASWGPTTPMSRAATWSSLENRKPFPCRLHYLLGPDRLSVVCLRLASKKGPLPMCITAGFTLLFFATPELICTHSPYLDVPFRLATCPIGLCHRSS